MAIRTTAAPHILTLDLVGGPDAGALGKTKLLALNTSKALQMQQHMNATAQLCMVTASVSGSES